MNFIKLLLIGIVLRFRAFIRKQPVRVLTFVSAGITLLVAFVFPDMDPAPFVALITAWLGLGELAQRVENNKTADALATEPPATE